jgi:hypothetical protein
MVQLDCVLGNYNSFYEFDVHDEMYTNKIESNIKLKQHQLVLLHQCILLENDGLQLKNHSKACFNQAKSNIGILADSVGSGKSYVILALLQINKLPLVNININSYNDQLGHLHFETKTHIYSRKLNSNILVIPFIIIKQWVTYIKKFDSKMSYFIINSHASLICYKQHINTNTHFDILIVSSKFYKYFCEYILIENICLNRVIFDEVDSSNTPCSKHIPANFYWFVSASYMNILIPYYNENYSSGITNNIFVKSIFSSFMKNLNYNEKTCLNHIIMKNNYEFVKESLSIIPENNNYIYCKSPYELVVLKGITNLNIINSLNAGDINTAISYINPSKLNHDESNIIQMFYEDLQNKITNIDIIIKSNYEMIYTNEAARNNKIEILKKDKVNLEYKFTLLKERINNNNICSICYCIPETKTITNCCKSSFCLHCITTWLIQKPKCPLCIKDLNIEDVFVVTNTYDKETHTTVYNEITQYTKFENMHKIMNDIMMNNESCKVLIFSEYDNSFVEIKLILDNLNIKSKIMKGIGSNNIIDQYIHQDINVLLINSKSYGSGLNLENTTDIILFHNMESQIMNQVIGRAQRPGRTSKLQVWHLLYENEK